MQRQIRRLVGIGLVLGTFLCLGGPSLAQTKSEKVRIDTVDGVGLIGNFWAGRRQAPMVIMLHAYKDNRSSKDWVNLAESLWKNGNGYSVLTFDFRGHGDSTEIDPNEFWKYQPNATLIKNAKLTRNTIDVVDFKPTYVPTLVNDIAAVKAYLDRRNDTGVLNTGSTILIGAEDGASLGALWLNSQWYMHKLVPNGFGGMNPDPQPDGKDVVACIWLSIDTKLGAYKASPRSLLAQAGLVNASPMVFIYGDGDATGKSLAKACEKYLKNPKQPDRYRYIGAFEIPNSNLTGAGLLKSPATSKMLGEWLDDVVLTKGNEWQEREWRKTLFAWRMGPQLVPARNTLTEMNLVFDTYTKFMAQ